MNTTLKYILKSAINIALFAFMVVQFSCSDYTIPEPSDRTISIPIGFPDVNFPEDNAYSKARWELGKKLFFDPILSKDSSVSCASCHKPELAFADNRDFSPGIENRAGTRNSPSLANVAYQPYLLREGSVPTLEMQVLVPIQEWNEFNHNIVDITAQLENNETYVKLSLQAYNRKPDPFVITRALGVFERSILSGNSAYDQYLNGNSQALNTSEIRGEDLFFSSKTNCSSCHSGFDFTDYSFQNNGLDTMYSDVGRFRFTGLEKDVSLFKVPSLRNVGLTAPYMHNGSLSTLSAVIEHYNTGGKPFVNRSEIIQPLHLTEQEKADLEAFLKSLSDFAFVNDNKWR